MKLAFSGYGRYAKYDDGYVLYCSRARSKDVVTKSQYMSIVKMYCKLIADEIEKTGFAELPYIGNIMCAEIDRKPQYRGNKFIGYGKRDYSKGGEYDGSIKAFGVVYMPNRDATCNLRCLGFVANRRLFKKLKKHNTENEYMLVPFNDDMI